MIVGGLCWGQRPWLGGDDWYSLQERYQIRLFCRHGKWGFMIELFTMETLYECPRYTTAADAALVASDALHRLRENAYPKWARESENHSRSAVEKAEEETMIVGGLTWAREPLGRNWLAACGPYRLRLIRRDYRGGRFTLTRWAFEIRRADAPPVRSDRVYSTRAEAAAAARAALESEEHTQTQENP